MIFGLFAQTTSDECLLLVGNGAQRPEVVAGREDGGRARKRMKTAATKRVASKKIGCDTKKCIDYITRLTYKIRTLLIEGRLPETIP